MVFNSSPDNLEAAKILIQNGADVNAKDYSQSTPLAFAAANGKQPC